MNHVVGNGGYVIRSTTLLVATALLIAPLLFTDIHSMPGAMPNLDISGYDENVASNALMNSSGPGIIWETSVGDAYSLTVSKDGSAFITKPTGLYLNDGVRLEKIDDSGDLDWSVDFPAITPGFLSYAGPATGPDGSVHFLVTQYNDSDDSSMAVHYHLGPDGNTIWEKVVHSFDGGMLSPPNWLIVDPNGTSYCCIFQIPNDSITLNDLNCSVFAVNSTGGTVWEHQFLASETGSCARTDEDGDLIMLIGRDLLLSMNPNGTVEWERRVDPLGSTYRTLAVGAGGRIYLSDEFDLFAFDVDGDKLWNISFPGMRHGGIAVSGDHIYLSLYVFASEKWDYNLYSYSSVGEVQWKKQLGYSRVPPIVDDAGTIIYCSGDKLYGLDHSGNVLWSYDSGGYITSTGLSEEGTLLFLVRESDDDKNLVASVGIPEVTLLEFMRRNVGWILLITTATIIIVGLFWFKVKRKGDGNRDLGS